MGVVLDAREQARRLKVGDDALAGLEPVEAAPGFGRRLVQPPMAVEQVDAVETVAAADLEIVEVVRRRDLDGARALFGVGPVVGDDRDAPAHERQERMAADQILVAFVVGMHGDGGVPEHGFGARRGDHDLAAAFEG